MLTVFWLSVGLVIYSYFLYPLLLKLLATEQDLKANEMLNWPSVDVVLSAYNEQSCIVARIENLLVQDYQGEYRILVASDGSKDRTGELISQFSDNRVIAYNFTENRGKVTVLNDLVSKSAADILVFTDANTDFLPNTVSQLVSSFSKKTGAVCGELHLVTDDDNQNADGLYWRYEQFLKKSESSLGALLGANGAIYAIRRALYLPLPTSTVVDDFCIVMNIKKQGYDVIYNDNAIASEEVAPSLQDEFGRRVRIGLGNYKAFVSHLWALSPLEGALSWCYWSHKVIRWFGPHLLLMVFFSNLFLVTQPFYLFSLVLQLIFYGLGFWGTRQIYKGRKVGGLVSIISFFVSMNLALGMGFIRFIRGNHKGSWKRTARTGEMK